MTKIEATIDKLVYRGESGWAVTRATRGDKVVTVVGMVGHLAPGDTAVFTGEWVSSKKWGDQFDAKSCEMVTPKTAAGIRKYLETLDDCGPIRARAIVDAYGVESLNLIWGSESALLDVPGIGKVAAKHIRDDAIARRSEAEAIISLNELGVPAWLIPKLVRRWGSEAADRVQEDPFALVRLFNGVGFKTADAIATTAGLPLSSPSRVQAGILHCLRESTGEGHTYLPRARLMQAACPLLGLTKKVVTDGIPALESAGEVVVDGEAIYLAAYHLAEQAVAERFLRIMRADATREPREPRVSILPFELDPIQRDAVTASTANKVLVLTGGPGTGKTTICRVILTAFRGMRVALASPTGRAARRLSQATGHHAMTIHRLLEYHPAEGWRRNRRNQLEVDLVLVDEVSMVDILLMNRLLDATPEGARVLLVGDADQLPSVGAGRVLGDLIDSGVVPVVELTQIKRQGRGSRIVVNAHRVLRGLGMELPERGEESDMYLVRKQDKDDARAMVVDLAVRGVVERFGFDPVVDVWVLTPQNKGALGTQRLNLDLQARLNPEGREVPFLQGRGLRIGDRVMQWKNDYDLLVFNGESGTIESFDAEEEEVSVRFDDRLVTYDKAKASNLRLAWATTIHKSQGSEYPCVILVVHRTHYRMLQRPLLYTGMTRARQLLIVVGQEAAIEVATRTAGRDDRHSGLCFRLEEREGGVLGVEEEPTSILDLAPGQPELDIHF